MGIQYYSHKKNLENIIIMKKWQLYFINKLKTYTNEKKYHEKIKSQLLEMIDDMSKVDPVFKPGIIGNFMKKYLKTR